MQNSFKDFLDRNGNNEAARELVAAENREIELYEKYKNYYSYGVYVARKLNSWKLPSINNYATTTTIVSDIV